MLVKYIGHVGKHTGYGRAGEHLCHALMKAGVDLVVRPFDGFDPGYLGGLPLAKRIAGPGPSRPDITIIHDLPMDVAKWPEKIGGGSPCVAYTTWEADTMPSYILDGWMDHFDQVWVPCKHNRFVAEETWIHAHNAGAYNNQETVVFRDPDFMRVVPHAYDDEAPPIERVKAHGDPFTFFWWGAINQRKNPLGVLRAYVHAFKATDDVLLHIHSTGLSEPLAKGMLGMLGLEQADMPRMKFSNGFKPLRDLVGDVYVTAARGEGWNLPAFEASVLAGAQVITPSNLGSDDYLFGSSARFVSAERAPALVDATIVDGQVMVSGAQGLSCRTLWRDPNLLQLSAHMKMAFEQNDRSISFGYNTAERYGYKAVGELMKNHLIDLLDNN